MEETLEHVLDELDEVRNQLEIIKTKLLRLLHQDYNIRFGRDPGDGNENGLSSTESNETSLEDEDYRAVDGSDGTSESSNSENKGSGNDGSDNSYDQEQSDSCSDSCWALDYAEEQHKVW